MVCLSHPPSITIPFSSINGFHGWVLCGGRKHTPSPTLLLGLESDTARYSLVNSIHSVTSYSIASGHLTLQHKFPKASEVRALVDVRLLLEKLTVEQTSVGQWVNVIGYISSPPSAPAKKQSSKYKIETPVVHVQALMLWSTGPLDISRYETCLANMT